MTLALQDALRLQPERDVVPDCAPGKQGRILEHDNARRVRSRDARLVLAQRSGPGLVEACDEAQQRGLAAAGGTEQRNELARLDGDADVAEHRQLGAGDVEGVADLSGARTAPPAGGAGRGPLDVERGARGRVSVDFSQCSCGYHFTVPFCQTSRRSRIANSSVIAPEQSNDITISAAYILA